MHLYTAAAYGAFIKGPIKRLEEFARALCGIRSAPLPGYEISMRRKGKEFIMVLEFLNNL